MNITLTNSNIIVGEKESFDVTGVWLKDAKLEDYKEKCTLPLGKRVFVPFSNILYIVEQI
jgi:hypothetical protein